MSLDIYTHIQKIIENGVDEFFEQVFEKNYIGLSDEELNILLILSCEKNEFEMAKIIYSTCKKLETTETLYFIFTAKHKVITETTLEICLLRAIKNGNVNIFNWLKELGTDVPLEKINLYWDSACKIGNLEIINKLYNSNIEEYENKLESGLKISLEKGNFELFKFLEKLGSFRTGSWIFYQYLKNSKINLDLFYYLYYNYNNYFDLNLINEFLKKNRFSEINIIFTYQNYSQEQYKYLFEQYIYFNRQINLQIIKLFLDKIYDTNFTIKKLIYCILTKNLYLDQVKDLIEYTQFNKDLINKAFEIVYKEFRQENNIDDKKNYGFFLEYLIERGYEPDIHNDFYYYYVEKKNEFIYENI